MTRTAYTKETIIAQHPYNRIKELLLNAKKPLRRTAILKLLQPELFKKDADRLQYQSANRQLYEKLNKKLMHKDINLLTKQSKADGRGSKETDYYVWKGREDLFKLKGWWLDD